MKRIKVYNLDGKSKRIITLPDVFETSLRLDVIQRAVVAQQSHRLQPQGRDPMAGKRNTAESYGVGRGLARIPRIKGERYSKSGQAAFAPGTVGGRLAHPPTTKKKIKKKINVKERRLALKSSIAATADKELVSGRGHRFNLRRNLPLVISDEFESLNRTEEALKVLEKLGVKDDIEKVRESTKERAGKGTMRGRRLKHAVGPLIIVSDDKGISKALRNIRGLHVIQAPNLSVESLAPGTHPGRLTVWSESALKSMNIFSEKVKVVA